MPRIHTQPTYGTFAVFGAALRRRMVNAFDAVLCRGRDQAASREVFRRSRELRRTANRATAAKEEYHRGSPVGCLPVGRKVEIDLQTALRRGLVDSRGFVAGWMDIGIK